MGQKLFFMVVFFIALASVGFVFAFESNFLPPSVYAFVYKEFNLSGPSAHAPYLEKFEGHWQGTLVPAQAWSDVERCATGAGTLTIENGVVSGNLGALSNYFTVTASVDEFGNLTGTFAAGGQNTGTISGTLSGMSGQATWKDSLDCQGTVTFTKLEPIVDPATGTVDSFIDGVMLERGSQTETPAAGEEIYAGDVLSLPAGSSAILSIGTGFNAQSMTLTGPTTYTVGAPTSQ